MSRFARAFERSGFKSLRVDSSCFSAVKKAAVDYWIVDLRQRLDKGVVSS